jgi:hypothetical protein
MRCIFALFSSLFLLSTCSSDLNKSNDNFNKKYREEIKKINEQRKPDKQTNPEKMFSRAPTAEEVIEDLANKIEYYPYVDIAELGENQRTDNLPNQEIYEQGKMSNPPSSLSPNVFEINYNLALYPPFQRVGAEFDIIRVPKLDAFGVTTEMADKSYLLAGNNSLQRVVDLINSKKTEDDIEITKMLVQEKKKMQRQNKTRQIFGQNLDNPDTIAPKKSAKIKSSATPIANKNTEQNQVSGFTRTVVKNTDTAIQK